MKILHEVKKTSHIKFLEDKLQRRLDFFVSISVGILCCTKIFAMRRAPFKICENCGNNIGKHFRGRDRNWIFSTENTCKSWKLGMMQMPVLCVWQD